MISEEEIALLFRNTKAAFEKSDIKQLATTRNQEWSYSISATRLKEGATVIAGFNWGVELDESYKPQEVIPSENFVDLYNKKWLGSLERIFKPLKQRLPNEDIDNAIQTNFCFFRSKLEDEITTDDLVLSTPLFNQLMNIIKPKRIIVFSKKLQSYYIGNNLCSNIDEANFPSNRRTLHTAKGIVKVGNLEVPVYFLPHPIAKFTSVARKNAWDFCFN